MFKSLKNVGPGLIITSAFIGPGTVTLCILSGIEYGYSLIWCVIFSIFATCYLQEISSRLGIISRKGLSEILIDIAQKKGPNHYAIVLGYSGWAAEQLEAEVANNDWLVVPYHQDILFDTPIEQRWHKTAALLGVDINRLSGQIGHV